MDAATSNATAPGALGTIITFYSFKGGVGRSMALANVAVLLARASKRVLCIDWDLEAPGLDRYFRAVPRSAPMAAPTLSEPTRVGGLLAILEGASLDALPPWRDYVRTRTGSDGSKLDFIGSGDDDETYSTRLSVFSWAEFFAQSGGGAIIEALRDAWKNTYDYVLIDSRTGLTDSSGICTIQLPDLIVMLFAANEQNVDWCQRIANGIRQGRRKLPYDRTFLPIIPLLSRFDAREESDRASEAMDRIAKVFTSFFEHWLPRSITPRDMLAWSVLPYIPRYSFEEALAVEDEPATGAQGLSFYYQLLSRLIIGRFKGIRNILANVGVPGAALPALLPTPTELDTELRLYPAAVERYRANIRERAEEEPIEAIEAFETLSNACISLSRLRDAEEVLDEAIKVLSDPSIASTEGLDRLKQKRFEILGPRRFRVAFSFAAEERDFVSKVAALLAQRFGQAAILYDKFHEAEFARADLGIYLPKLYAEQSDLIVTVASPGYDPKHWVGLEWFHIHAFMATGVGHRILLCRFDGAEFKGLSANAGFIELDHKTPEEVAILILERLALNEGRSKDHHTKDPGLTSFPAGTNIPNNLPRLPFFFGREAELKKVAAAIAPESRGWGALIDGPGGIGKTTLAIRAAELVPAGRFRRIIFLSSKERELSADGQRALGHFVLPGYLDVLNAIARELGQPDLAKSLDAERSELVLRELRDAEVLLILDNLETLPPGDRDQLFAFLNRLPRGCSAIVTTRRRADVGAVNVRLDRLDWLASQALFEELGKHIDLLGRASDEERRALYEETGGNPLLIRWVVGHLGQGSCQSIAAAVALLRSAEIGNNPLEFIFGDLLDTFTPSQERVLAALTHFSEATEVKYIAELSGISEAAAQTALDDLASRALVVPDIESRRFALVPMVADFLQRKRPEIVEETGDRLEDGVYALLIENGYKRYDRFNMLDGAWSSVAAALPRFLVGPNDRLQTVCHALRFFLEFTGRWDEWLALSREGEAKAVSHRDFTNAGWRAYEAGWVHRLRGQSVEVVACADRADAYWSDGRATARERAFAVRLRGAGHEIAGNYTSAIVAYGEAVKLWRTLSPESEDVALGLNALANVENAAGNLDVAERDYHEALRIARALDDREGIAVYTGNLGGLALKRGDLLGSELLAREALSLSEMLGRQELIASNGIRLAKVLVQQGRRAEALRHARRTVEIFTALRSPDLEDARKTLAECES